MGSAASSICNIKKSVYLESNQVSLMSRMIDEQLQKDARIKKNDMKILLLGASDSGKSTIVKQMRLLHTDGFMAEEYLHYRYTIFSNCLESVSHIARGIQKLGIDVPFEEKNLVEQFAGSYDGQLFQWLDDSGNNRQLVNSMHKFMHFKCVQLTFKMMHEFYVPDNTSYILENADRILKADYEKPTKEDIIHARASTRGVYEINFAFKNFTIRLIDVGGQKTERRKWIHCFEDVNAILFIVSLACYNQVMDEDGKTNQLADSLELFTAIYRNKFMRKSFCVLFFNKKDLFKKKIQSVPLKKYFPKFNESEKMSKKDMPEEALKFIKQLFMGVKGGNNQNIYSHVTNATDSKNIDFVFNASCDIIIASNMQEAGMN